MSVHLLTFASVAEISHHNNNPSTLSDHLLHRLLADISVFTVAVVVNCPLVTNNHWTASLVSQFCATNETSPLATYIPLHGIFQIN